MILRAIIPLSLSIFFLSSGCCALTGRKSDIQANKTNLQSNDGLNGTKSDSVRYTNSSGQDTISTPNDNMNDQTEQKLIRGKWILVEFDGTPILNQPPDGIPFIEFKSENQRIQGYAGCNNFFGKYLVTDAGKISFSEIGATKKYCAESMETENAFFNILSKSYYIEFTENRLIFKGTDQFQTVILRRMN